MLESYPIRPDRLTSTKNDVYHLQMAKYAFSTGYNNTKHARWLRRSYVNKQFYMNNQWIVEEDVQTFLMDTTGNTNTRIKWTQNMIRPMVEQYRGNAIILNINAAAKSLSQNSINRRDEKLAEQLFKTEVARQFPAVGEIMRANDPSIGKNSEQTETIFENLYVDKLVEELNELLNFSKNLNKFTKKQLRAAENLALTGITIEQSLFHGAHLRFETIEPEDFFFDHEAREKDLTDAEYMGTVKGMDLPLLLERYQIDYNEAKALESYSNSMGSTTTTRMNSLTDYSNGRVPVITVYWKDSERYKYGWVLDEYGYPVLERIGKRNDQNDLQEAKYYTEEDLITPPDTPKNRKLFPNGSKTATMYCDVIRYCTYIPGDYKGPENKSEVGDIVLDYGMEPYQETNYQDLSNVKFPFKIGMWAYVDGEVLSPVDDAIDPQRFVNRMISMTEARFNSSGGSNVILDEDSVEDVSQANADIKDGKPITVRSKGKGIPNTVGYYDATPKAGTYQMWSMVQNVKQSVQEVTGVNEGLKGESTGSDQLVGVTKLQIQRGSLMQEPFYNALSDMFYQMYDCIASVGKKYYIDNERELAIIGGDESLKIFKLSKEIRNEDFLIFVEKENSDETLKNNANQMLLVFLEMGMINQEIFSNLYDRSTPSKVMSEVRKFVKIQKEAERMAEEQQNAMMQEQAVAQQQMMEQANVAQAKAQATETRNRLMEKEMDQQNTMEQIMAKEMATGNK